MELLEIINDNLTTVFRPRGNYPVKISIKTWGMSQALLFEFADSVGELRFGLPGTRAVESGNSDERSKV